MGWIYRNLILPSVLFLIAWNLAPFFTTLVSFIPVEEAFAWLGGQIEILVTGTDGTLRPPEFYIEVIVWTLVLWLLVQGISLPFGALVGATENFSERKLYRHTQYFGLILLLAAIYPALIFIVPQLSREAFVVVGFMSELATDIVAEAETFGEFRRGALARLAIIERETGQIAPTFILHFTTDALMSNPWIFAGGFVVYLILLNILLALIAPNYEAIVRFLESSRFGKGGSGRFAGLLEELNTRRESEEALYYGNSLYNPWTRIGGKDDRHMLTFAGSRTGKGATCIIPNLLTWGGSAFVIDPKGTAAHVTMRKRLELGQRVILIDPFSRVTPHSDAYNPLEFLDPEADTIVEDIGVIAEALILSEPGGRNEHFTSGAKSLIAGYIAQAITDPEIRNPSLFTVYDMLLQLPEDHHRLHARMALNDRAGGVAKRAALRVLQGGASNEFRSVQATALEQTNWIASPGMRRVLDRSTFRLEELRGEERLRRLPEGASAAEIEAWKARRENAHSGRASLYLIVPPQFIDVHKRFIRLFVNTAISRFVAAGRAPFPTLFLIDEAHSLGTMHEVSRAYGLLAGYNMFLWTFFQDKGQLDRLYGAEAESFISSSRATQVFGVTDDTTVNFVSNQLGKRTLKRGAFLRDTEAVDLRSPGDVRLDIERDMNRQYVLRNGRTPLILERVPYFRSSRFLLDAGTDPDYPDPKGKAQWIGVGRRWGYGIAGVAVTLLVIRGWFWVVGQLWEALTSAEWGAAIGFTLLTLLLSIWTWVGAVKSYEELTGRKTGLID